MLSLEQTLEVWAEAEADGDDAVRALILEDRFYLLVSICGRHDMVHPWIYERCREVEDSPDGHLDIWGREHYKSTIITYGGVIQEILRDPEITIGIFSHTKPTAKAFLAQIKRELESNDKLQRLFPDILYANPAKEALSWSLDGGIIVKRKSNPKEATIEANGLVDGQPTSKHYRLLVYDDVVTKESVGTPEQIQKTTEAWELSDNLGSEGGRKWHVGTRYCTIGSMRITMSDWTQRPIESVQIGDEIVGWEMRDGKRYLRPAKVINRGVHRMQPVNRYTFEHGRSVVCTDDHKWWRGPHGGGAEYAPLGLPAGKRKGRPPKGKKLNGRQMHICELMEPVEVDQGRDAGWLAGMFDGEGTTKKNTGKNRVSGCPCIVQTVFNPEIVDEIRACLKRLKFEWSESWIKPAPSRHMRHDRCCFMINGGWRERYRFLAQIAPTKVRALLPTLFAQLQTEKRKLVKIEPQEAQDVHWLETETGNYIVEGFCSSNSFGDTYQAIIERGSLRLRHRPATHDGTMEGRPVLLSEATWRQKCIDQGEATISCQMLGNPLAGHQRMFDVNDLQVYEVRPETLGVYIMIDPARSKKKGSANTAMVVLGLDYAGNKYLLDGYDHKMDLQGRWEAMRNLWARWKGAPGVQSCRVGYERYGAIADLDYFTERKGIERCVGLNIEELEWPFDGEASKVDRVQRLGPDLRNHRFFLPYPSDPANLTSSQRRMKDSGYEYRISRPIKRKDENGNLYDLSERLKMQVHYFPFGGLKDVIDATARIYDMDPKPPIIVDQSVLEPEFI